MFVWSFSSAKATDFMNIIGVSNIRVSDVSAFSEMGCTLKLNPGSTECLNWLPVS